MSRAAEADEYEDDDTYLTARVINTGSSATSVLHNFHDEGDEDWVKFYGYVDDYNVYVTGVGSRCAIVIEIYKRDGKTLFIKPFDETGAGEDVTFTLDVTEEDIYFVRLRNSDPATYGEDTEYKLMVKVTTSGKPLPSGIVVGFISDSESGEGINNGLIKTNAGAAALPDRGYYIMLHPAGGYFLTVTADGYLTAVTQFQLDAGQQIIKDISMTPDGSASTSSTSSSTSTSTAASTTTTTVDTTTTIVHTTTTTVGETNTTTSMDGTTTTTSIDDGDYKGGLGEPCYEDGTCNEGLKCVGLVCMKCPASSILDEDDPRLDTIRQFRDELLAKSTMGRKLTELYYKNGKKIIAILDRYPEVKNLTKKLLESLVPVMEMMLKNK